jgi:DNA-directed RNA polymerase subunit RPC12/RpoP
MVAVLTAPAAFLRPILNSNFRYGIVYLFAIAAQAEEWMRDDLTARGSFLERVGISAALWAGVAFVFVAIDSLRAKEIARRGDPRRDPMQVRRAMLERDCCPSCAEDLDGRPEADDCRVCRNCGGAWRHIYPVRATGARNQKSDECASCGYPLADLPLHADGRAICPECGWGQVVDDVAWRSSPRCWNCKRSLRGLPLVNGDRVQCPDCGQWRSGLTEADVRPADATVP